MIAICGECKLEEEHEIITKSVYRSETLVMLRCRCGHTWEEADDTGACENCEDV
jgi:hypothetical protein